MVAISPEMAQANSGGAVMAVTYVLVIITLLFTVLRITVSSLRQRVFGADDGLLILSVLLGLLSAICTGNAVVNGLGRYISTINPAQLMHYFKLSYSANIFTILAMASSKASVVVLMQRLSPPNSPFTRYIRLLHFVIASWTVLSVFGLAFQCDVPSPWLYAPSRCTGHGAIWYPIVVSSIVTDLVLAFGFVPTIKTTPMISKRMPKFMSLFLVRLIVPVFSIIHIALLAPALSSVDQTRAMATPSILLQITMDLSIFTAAIPALSRFLVSLEPVSSTTVVSEITAVNLDPSHSRATSDENNKLRDWAFAQLRSTPTPNSLNKEMSVDVAESPRKPEPAHIGLDRSDTAPPIPARSDRRAASPQLTLNFAPDSSHLDVKEAWFVDSKRTSATTEDSIDVIKNSHA